MLAMSKQSGFVLEKRVAGSEVEPMLYCCQVER